MSPKCILVLVALLTLGLEGASGNGANEAKTCRTVVGNINRFQIGQINTCANRLGYKTTKEKLNKSACIMKCVMQIENLVTADGAVSLEKLRGYIDSHFPLSLRPRAQVIFEPCVKLARGIAGAPKGDPLCKSHGPFVKCMMRNIAQLCLSLTNDKKPVSG